jgi:hypothetical protein
MICFLKASFPTLFFSYFYFSKWWGLPAEIDKGLALLFHLFKAVVFISQHW